MKNFLAFTLSISAAVVAAAFLTASCSSTEEVTVRHLEPSRTIDSFGEEIYISDGIMSIIEDDGHLYFMETDSLRAEGTRAGRDRLHRDVRGV